MEKIDPTWKVGESSDDCYRVLETSLFFSLTGDIRAGYEADIKYEKGSGMRFTNITIPKGATIDSAYLTLRCRYQPPGTAVKSRISAENVDNAPTFADDGAVFDARFNNHTAARVDWDNIPVWTSDVDYNSPEIKTVVQEVIDRGGWASGNAIVIFWEDFDDRSTHADGAERVAYSYDGSTTYAPKLVVSYTTPAGRSFGLIIG